MIDLSQPVIHIRWVGHTPPSGPNIPAPGSCAYPAYRAPVKPARGLLPVPAAKFVGTPGIDGVAPVPEACVADVLGVEELWRWLLAALLTRWMV